MSEILDSAAENTLNQFWALVSEIVEMEEGKIALSSLRSLPENTRNIITIWQWFQKGNQDAIHETGEQFLIELRKQPRLSHLVPKVERLAEYFEVLETKVEKPEIDFSYRDADHLAFHLARERTLVSRRLSEVISLREEAISKEIQGLRDATQSQERQ